MNNIRKMGALVGAGAALFSLVGCADKDGGGQAESPMAANNVGGAVADNLGDTANAASGAVGGVANAASGAASGVANNLGDTANAASGAVGAVGNNLGETANAAKNVVSGAGGAISGLAEAATVTPAVKTAIGANAGLAGSTINVDTLPAKDSIALRGKVKSAAQKTLAESVAKKAAPGYKIVNQLTTGG